MKPAARITINGRDVTTALFGGDNVLSSLTITDQAGVKSDTLEMDLDDRESFKAPPPGTQIQVWLGYEPKPVYMGLYKVDQWVKRGPRRTLHVSAKAAELTTDIRAAKVRSWHATTIEAIVSQIASEHGLKAIVDSEIASRAIEHIDQQHESNLGFLSRLAHRNGAVFKLANGSIVVSKKGSTRLPSGATKPTFTLTPDMVDTWTATSQNRGDYSSVVTEYADPKHGKRGHHREGSGNPTHRVRVLYASKDEAKRAARAALGDLKRGKANFECEGQGLPAAFADMILIVKNFDPDVDGDYLVKTVTHTLQNNALRTTITAELAGDDTSGQTDGNDADSPDDTSGDTSLGETEASP